MADCSANLAKLIRYRGLIQSLVARELKARYRGLGPRLPLVVHQPAAAALDLLVRVHGRHAEPQPEGAAVRAVHVLRHPAVDLVLVVADRGVGLARVGGNLIKKVLFPAEMLPIVSVLANMVHSSSACRSWSPFLICYRHWPDPLGLLWFPVVVLVQLVFTSALALILSALTVHFRDIRDILSNLLMLWFFATPIIYLAGREVARLQAAVRPATRSRTSSSRTRKSCSSPGRSATGSGCWRSAGCRSCCSSPATGSSTGCAIRLRRR